MLTGDFPAHDEWIQTVESKMAHNRAVIKLVRQYFPESIVIPSLGNHDAFPFNSFPPSSLDHPRFNVSWLYRRLGNLYGNWIPAEAESSFLQDGYFTFLLRPGFRIVVINSNSYMGYNL